MAHVTVLLNLDVLRLLKHFCFQEVASLLEPAALQVEQLFCMRMDCSTTDTNFKCRSMQFLSLFLGGKPSQVVIFFSTICPNVLYILYYKIAIL